MYPGICNAFETMKLLSRAPIPWKRQPRVGIRKSARLASNALTRPNANTRYQNPTGRNDHEKQLENDGHLMVLQDLRLEKQYRARRCEELVLRRFPSDHSSFSPLHASPNWQLLHPRYRSCRSDHQCYLQARRPHLPQI